MARHVPRSTLSRINTDVATESWRTIVPIAGLAGVLWLGCSQTDPASGRTSAQPRAIPVEIRINEVVSDNQGVWEDEAGETDDYVELINVSSVARDLNQYLLADSSNVVNLPDIILEPNQVALLWADNNLKQGQNHVGLKINAQGEPLTLSNVSGQVVDQVDVPALAAHHAYLRMPDGTGPFEDCGWATPTRLNGTDCGPPPLPDLPDTTTWATYSWPSPWPAPSQPLMLTELALRPANFIEVLNTSNTDVDLTGYQLRVAPHLVGVPWPDVTVGTALAWPVQSLAKGQRVAVPVTDADITEVAATSSFEGVVTLWSAVDSSAIDRKDFSYYPDNAALARVPDPTGAFRYCTNSSKAISNDDCQPLATRPLGDHVRDLSTPGDFAALASGRGNVGAAAVEFIDDMASGDVITFLNSADWDIHYCFIREFIQGLPHLDRCIPDQQLVFNQGWWDFSVTEYFKTEGRRYLLGTLVTYAGSNAHTVEFTPGDIIESDQMLHAFNAVLRHVHNPTEWSLRAQDTGPVYAPDLANPGDSIRYPSQIDRIRKIDGQLPIVDSNAPFRGETFQPLVPTVGFGTLRFVAADAFSSAELGPRDIVITNQVPLNIPLIAGLITEAFQTPLAHVNVLSRGRGTPNMALENAREDPQLKPLIGKLVRLEVRASDFVVEEANVDDALAFWDSRKPQGPPASARLDSSIRKLLDLQNCSIKDIPSIGGKAAQLAELGRTPLCTTNGSGIANTRIPIGSFAIPMAYSLEHFERSGAKARLAQLRQDSSFRADSAVRAQGLAAVRSDILSTSVDATLLADVRKLMAATWPGQRVRFRSSSNVEDLPGFNGAGLYVSEGIDAGTSSATVADAIRDVWSSLWMQRAYDEREYFNVDQDSVAMAVLVQEAFPSEKANGVAISRDVLAPSDGDKFYINAQVGEALVTNPAPGIASDQFTYSLWRSPHIERVSESSFGNGNPVLTDEESYRLACSLQQIHDHFRPLIDPDRQNSWFAMDIEFKLIGDERQLVIKQARPYSFGQEAPTGWCDL
jgi:hypothetical protein